MSAMLRAELLKLRTTRTFVALVGAALALSLLLVVLTITLSDSLDDRDLREVYASDFSGLFIFLLGIIGMAGEWRHRTITGSILAGPQRVRFLAAKVLAYATAGAVLSVVVQFVSFAVGAVLLSTGGEENLPVSDLADVFWRNLVLAAYAGAFGVCVGALLRNQVVAVIGLLVVSFAVEPTLLFLVDDVGRYLPTNGAPAGVIDAGGYGDEVELLDTVPALAVLAAWVAVLFAAGAARLRYRDLV